MVNNLLNIIIPYKGSRVDRAPPNGLPDEELQVLRHEHALPSQESSPGNPGKNSFGKSH